MFNYILAVTSNKLHQQMHRSIPLALKSANDRQRQMNESKKKINCAVKIKYVKIFTSHVADKITA